MQNIILYLVKLIHILVILFIVITPFIGNNYLLLIHFIVTPFIILHWLLNDNTCCLTIMEKVLAKDKNYKGILSKIIEPVYDFKKNNESYSILIYAATFVFWSISTYKLYNGFTSIPKPTRFTIQGLSSFLLS
jgi:hypothetical protein